MPSADKLSKCSLFVRKVIEFVDSIHFCNSKILFTKYGGMDAPRGIITFNRAFDDVMNGFM